MNRAMISYHFGGKRNLYAAILAATFQEIVSRVERIAESAGPAPEVLRAIVAAIGDAATHRHPHFCTMMLREVLSGGQHMATAVLAQPARVLAAVQRVVERGVREGAFRPVDPLLTHLSLVGSLVFFFATTGFRAARDPGPPAPGRRHLRQAPPGPDHRGPRRRAAPGRGGVARP